MEIHHPFMDVGQNGRPRGPQMLVWFSINHPMIGVPNFDPLGQTNVYPVAWLVKKTSWMLGMLATPRKIYYWLVVSTILKNIKVNGKDYPIYGMEK